jgi:hypothetical protein
MARIMLTQLNSRRLAVATRGWILFLLPAAMISVVVACGGNTANVQNPPPPPASNVSIAFQPAPASSILVNASTNLTAVVSNDPSNAGVDWSLVCQSAGNCGSLTPPHTASGQATSYTPPATLLGNNQTVTVVAFATADHTKNLVAPITVTAFGSNLKGTYVLQAGGVDSSLNPYQFAGVIVLDGNGGVSSGEQTVNFFDPNPNVNALVTRPDSITGGSYFLGPDGRGTISINTNDADLGASGTETFSFVFLSGSQALITALPTSTILVSGIGTMDLQSSTAAPSAGYAFVVSGTDFSTGSPTALGGIFNIDSPNSISGKGSVTDQNLAGTLTAGATLSGTLSNPDSFGAVTLNLNTPSFPTTTAYQFTGYIVDGAHIKLIESDNTSGSGLGATTGLAIGQGSATGTFEDDTSFSGTYVFGVLGQDLSAISPSSLTSVGVLTADGSGDVANGFTDTFLQANSVQGTAGAQISAAFGGTYSVNHQGTGRLRATFNHFLPRLNDGFSPVFFFYLTGNGNPPLLLASGDSNYTFLGAGIAYPQSTAPLTFGGKYGFIVSQQNGSENEGTGQMTANPPAGTLSGFVDINVGGSSASFDNPFTGTFTPPGSNGRFSGTLAGQVFEVSPFAAEYYIIDPGHGFFVETDVVNPNSPSGVVSFGYYAVRTPVCDGCP